MQLRTAALEFSSEGSVRQDEGQRSVTEAASWVSVLLLLCFMTYKC